MKVTVCLARRSSTPHARQTFTIRRRPYDSIRAVVSLCRPLLASATPQVPALGPFMDAVAGAPSSPHHEGPLDQGTVTSLREHLADATLHDVGRDHLFRGELLAQPHAWMTNMWSTALQQRYTTALLNARQEMLEMRKAADKSAAFTLPRREAGLTMLDVFAAGGDSDDAAPLPVHAQQWRQLIDAYTPILPDRSRLHELENSPQEITLGELVLAEVAQLQSRDPSWRPECVVDVGGGNAFLLAQVAERLQCDGLVIDPHTPLHAIDCLPYLWPCITDRCRPAQPRRQVLHRLQSFFEDVRWADAVPASPDRTVLIAKHLCGSAIDECLRRLEAQRCLPRVLLLAPCCFNKIQLETYCNPPFLSQALSAHDQDVLARLTRLTDWNMTCCQHAHEVHLYGRRCPVNPLLRPSAGSTGEGAALVSMQDSQRYGGVHSVAYHVPCMNAIAQIIEGVANYGRAQWLRARGYTQVTVTQYVPDCVTPKNKCIIAVRQT